MPVMPVPLSVYLMFAMFVVALGAQHLVKRRLGQLHRGVPKGFSVDQAVQRYLLMARVLWKKRETTLRDRQLTVLVWCYRIAILIAVSLLLREAVLANFARDVSRSIGR